MPEVYVQFSQSAWESLFTSHMDTLVPASYTLHEPEDAKTAATRNRGEVVRMSVMEVLTLCLVICAIIALTQKK